MKLAFIGAGNMASAIMNAMASNSLYTCQNIAVTSRHPEKLLELERKGYQLYSDNKQCVIFGDMIILAVKPQNYDEVLEEIGELAAGKCLISLAPGVSTGYIKSKCPGSFPVRVMPNTPLLVGMGATAIAESNDVPTALFDEVVRVFSGAGTVSIIPESLMNEIVAVSGSSPAYFFRFTAAMVEEAHKLGIDRETALNMTAQTMAGAAKMLLTSGKSAAELTAQVTSKGGTTLAALTAFDELGLDDIVAQAMERCTKRAKELGR